MEVQIDGPERRKGGRRQRCRRRPDRIVAVCLQNARSPRAADVAGFLTQFPEHELVSRLVIPGRISLRHLEHRLEPRGNRQHARVAVLGLLDANGHLSALQIDVAPLKAEEFAASTGAFQRCDDQVL